MKHTHGEGVLVVALAAALFGCQDAANRTVGPTASADVQAGPTPSSSSSSSSEERAALTRITRLVAVAMDSEPARQRLKRDMRAAPFREHKLQLGSYLRSADGKAVLGRMVALSGAGEKELFETLAAVRPLELYMPVRKHRESWTGSADVLVVSQLDEGEAITAFDDQGNSVVVDRVVPPEQPTLSIVPVETRFDQPMPITASKNVRDRSGAAVGTLEPMTLKPASLFECGEDCSGGGGGGGAPAIAPGIYLEFSRILDMKEPWIRGDPELEVHIQGPREIGSPTSGVDLSCSGEHAYEYAKVFNQDDGFWEGRVLLFSEAEIVAFTNKFQQGFHVLFWEDDNDPCVLKLDTNVMVEAVQSTAGAFGTVALKAIPTAPWYIVAGAFVATFFSNAGEWLLTNDDFVGAAVDQASAGYNYPGNTHVIMDRTTLNGRATIVYRH
jgi:hypothetical protein